MVLEKSDQIVQSGVVNNLRNQEFVSGYETIASFSAEALLGVMEYMAQGYDTYLSLLYGAQLVYVGGAGGIGASCSPLFYELCNLYEEIVAKQPGDVLPYIQSICK